MTTLSKEDHAYRSGQNNHLKLNSHFYYFSFGVWGYGPNLPYPVFDSCALGEAVIL
jgi:hypothetical protein